MTMIRTHSVPTPTARRVQPAADARGSNDRPSQQSRALVPVPTPRPSKPRAKTTYRARNAATEVMVQVIAGNPKRGIRAEATELQRYHRTYAQAATGPVSNRPSMERCA